MLNSSIESDNIAIAGFSKDIVCNDHPSNIKTGACASIIEMGCQVNAEWTLSACNMKLLLKSSLHTKNLLFSCLPELHQVN